MFFATNNAFLTIDFSQLIISKTYGKKVEIA